MWCFRNKKINKMANVPPFPHTPMSEATVFFLFTVISPVLSTCPGTRYSVKHSWVIEVRLHLINYKMHIFSYSKYLKTLTCYSKYIAVYTSWIGISTLGVHNGSNSGALLKNATSLISLKVWSTSPVNDKHW